MTFKDLKASPMAEPASYGGTNKLNKAGRSKRTGTIGP